MNICFFCASSETLDPKYYKITEEFAIELVKRNHNLVTGGSNVGMMRILAETVKKNNGYGIGIIPKIFVEKGLICRENNEIYITEDLHERKKKLFDHSDAFVILPGGYGTLDELLEIITLVGIGVYNKPIVIFNFDGFYNPLIEMFQKIVTSNFATYAQRPLYYVAENICDTFEHIENFLKK